MNLTHKCVVHPVFGQGIVTQQDDTLLHVSFSTAGEKIFLFPDAFASHLSLSDDEACAWIRDLIKKRSATQKAEKRRQDNDLLRTIQEDRRQAEMEKLLHAHRTGRAKTHPQSQIVFCCDGESPAEVLRNKEIYCGKVSKAGRDPRFVRAARLRPNSAGLLTAKPAGVAEDKRVIVGAFLIEAAFYNADSESGMIPFHPEYMLDFSKQTDRALYFEPYRGELLPIGRVRYRYFDNVRMAHVLSDLLELHQGTEQEEPCARFFQTFCRLNGISQAALKERSEA